MRLRSGTCVVWKTTEWHAFAYTPLMAANSAAISRTLSSPEGEGFPPSPMGTLTLLSSIVYRFNCPSPVTSRTTDRVRRYSAADLAQYRCAKPHRLAL